MGTIREKINYCLGEEDRDAVMSLVDEIEDAVTEILQSLTVHSVDDLNQIPKAYRLTDKLKTELY